MRGGPLTYTTAERVRELVGSWEQVPSLGDLERLLRVLAKWRSQVLGKTYLGNHGPTVRDGPFAGMRYLAESTEGSLCARLLGSYEHVLHAPIDAIMAGGADCVIDVGCAEGYYAVGMAHAYRHVEVYAYDILEDARRACAELAALNGVSDRVHIGAEFKPTDFEAFADRRPLILVDTEGAELEILRPDLSPALAGMSLIVETHSTEGGRTIDELIRRFQPTHEIQRLDQQMDNSPPPSWMAELSELDLYLIRWEWRSRLTPWLVMTPKAAGG